MVGSGGLDVLWHNWTHLPDRGTAATNCDRCAPCSSVRPTDLSRLWAAPVLLNELDSAIKPGRSVTILHMLGVLDLFLLAVLLLSMVHFVLPRHPLLKEDGGQLALRPPARRLFGESIGLLGMLLGVVWLLFLLASAKIIVGVALVSLVALRICWLVGRKWRAERVVFDRRADFIRQGPIQIGRASQATVVHVTGEPAPALALFIRDGADESTGWPVPGVDRAHAPTIGRAIADYLGVPLVTRLD